MEKLNLDPTFVDPGFLHHDPMDMGYGSGFSSSDSFNNIQSRKPDGSYDRANSKTTPVVWPNSNPLPANRISQMAATDNFASAFNSNAAAMHVVASTRPTLPPAGFNVAPIPPRTKRKSQMVPVVDLTSDTNAVASTGSTSSNWSQTIKRQTPDIPNVRANSEATPVVLLDTNPLRTNRMSQIPATDNFASNTNINATAMHAVASNAVAGSRPNLPPANLNVLRQSNIDPTAELLRKFPNPLASAHQCLDPSQCREPTCLIWQNIIICRVGVFQGRMPIQQCEEKMDALRKIAESCGEPMIAELIVQCYATIEVIHNKMEAKHQFDMAMHGGKASNALQPQEVLSVLGTLQDWRVDFREQKRWEDLEARISDDRLSTATRQDIKELSKKRKAIKEVGIPCYISTKYVKDRNTANGLVSTQYVLYQYDSWDKNFDYVNQFPRIQHKIQAWLKLKAADDEWAQQQRRDRIFKKKDCLGPLNKPRWGTFKVTKDSRSAPGRLRKAGPIVGSAKTATSSLSMSDETDLMVIEGCSRDEVDGGYETGDDEYAQKKIKEAERAEFDAWFWSRIPKPGPPTLSLNLHLISAARLAELQEAFPYGGQFNMRDGTLVKFPPRPGYE